MINTRRMQDGPDQELVRALLAGQNRRGRLIAPVAQFETAISFLKRFFEDFSVKDVDLHWFCLQFERNDTRITNRAAFGHGILHLPVLSVEFDDLEKKVTYTGYIEGAENIAKFISWLEISTL